MVTQTVDLSFRTSGNVFAPSGFATSYVNLPYDNAPTATQPARWCTFGDSLAIS